MLKKSFCIALGAQDRNLTLYGSQFNMSTQYNASIFHQLKEKLVTDGHMAVIQYDKRSCKSPQYVGLHNFANTSVNYTGEYGPICEDQCPSWCNSKISTTSTCPGLYPSDCYNDTNITINDIISDAKRALNQGEEELKSILDGNIVNIKNLWKIPIGHSAQGASIASYLASTNNYWYPTVISLMGAGIDIDELLISQLQTRMKSMKKTDEEIDSAIDDINTKFIDIRNGTLKDKDMISIANDFLDETDKKHVKYWRDWLELTDNVNYQKLDNFLAINSYDDDKIDYDSFKGLMAVISEENVTMNLENYYLRNVNHWMIDTDNFEKGQWEIDDKVSEHIITFLNDISGYKDKIERYIRLNNSNVTVIDDVLIENDMVYKVLLYLMIMAIVMILSLGIYCVVARKVCPYEFMDDDQQQAEEDALLRERAERDRRRRRRRRHRDRERRRRSSRSSQSQSQHNDAVAIASSSRSRNGSNNNGNSNDLNEPMLQRVENVLLEEATNNNGAGHGLINHDDNNNGIGNGVLNGDVDDPLATSTQNAILNEYVD